MDPRRRCAEGRDRPRSDRYQRDAVLAHRHGRFDRERLLRGHALRELADADEHWSEFDCGGHFAAMEVPDLLIGDVRKFFRKLR
jgi:pimeloyl-ACP methyl ester carboxylesterase